MHETLTERMLWLGRRIGLRSRRAVFLASAMGVLVVFGTAGLLLYSVSTSDEPTSPATQALASPDTQDTLVGLRSAAGDSDVWRTQAQRNRQWQVAKMATLSRLLSSFPAIRRATVLFDSGRAAKLGNSGVPASASVHVVLVPEAEMTGSLLRAVVDQVVGSVSGLSAESVRVIDGAGRSYTLAEASGLPRDTRVDLQRRRQAEARYRERILSALRYIPDVVVVVEAESAGADVRCGGATLSLPRRYAERIYHRGNAVGSGPKSVVLEAIMQGEADRIRGLVATVAGVPMERVGVEWHYAVSPARNNSVVRATNKTTVTAGSIVLAGMLGGVEIALVVAIGIRRIRRRRHRLAWSRVRGMAQRCRARGISTPEPCAPFEAIKQASVDDLVTLLSAEPSQTVAVVLTHLSPARAAKVLARLSASKQIEVTEQIANLGQVDSAVLEQAGRDLAERLRAHGQYAPAGGIAAVARILQHTGQAGRKNVLETLEVQNADLAERIGRRLLRFEDLADMDTDRLAGALGSLTGEELALALWTAEASVQDRIRMALSPVQHEALEAEAERLGSVRLSQVESAQQRVVEVVREFEAGQLAWAAAGKDEQLA